MDQQETEKCDNCGKDLPSSKIATHFGYCRRNVKKCPTCGEMYDINFQEEHEEDYHKKEKCSFCKKQFNKNDVEAHQSKCTMKPKFCEYCDQNIPPNQFQTHVRACQSRTKMCDKCGLPVTNKDFLIHITQCQGPPPRQVEKERNEYNPYSDVSSRQMQMIKREKQKQLEQKRRAQQRRQYANINYQPKRQPVENKYTFNYPNQQKPREEGRLAMERRQRQQRERKIKQEKLRKQRQANRQIQAQKLKQKRQMEQRAKIQQQRKAKYQGGQVQDKYSQPGRIGVVDREKYKMNRDVRAQQQPISRNQVPDIKAKQPQPPSYSSKEVNYRRASQVQPRKYDFQKKNQIPRRQQQYKQQYNRKQQVRPAENIYRRKQPPQQQIRPPPQYEQYEQPIQHHFYDDINEDPQIQKAIYLSMSQKPKYPVKKQQIPPQFEGVTDMNESFYRDVALQQELMEQHNKNKKKR